MSNSATLTQVRERVLQLARDLGLLDRVDHRHEHALRPRVECLLNLVYCASRHPNVRRAFALTGICHHRGQQREIYVLQDRVLGAV